MAPARPTAAPLEILISPQDTTKQSLILTFRSPISNFHQCFIDFRWILLTFVDLCWLSLIFVSRVYKSIFTPLISATLVSPHSPRGKKLLRPIDWCQFFYILCLVARSWIIFRHSIKVRSKFYRNSMEILSKFHRSSIEVLSTFYRHSIKFS